MNAIDLLTDQHRAIEHLFDRLARLQDDDVLGRRELFARIAEALALHTALEDDHVYPMAARFRRPEAQAEAVAEHEELKRQLADLLQMDVADPAFEPKLRALRDELVLHLEEEESELFPALEQLVDDAALLDLGVTLEEEARARGLPAEGEVTPAHDPRLLN